MMTDEEALTALQALVAVVVESQDADVVRLALAGLCASQAGLSQLARAPLAV